MSQEEEIKGFRMAWMRFIPVSETIPLPPTLPALNGICMTADLSSKNRDIIATHIQA